ncbi:MAG TPA: glycosyltransferase, partial [Gemmatimonadaceae bacterium]|nr:glycosyltransferase [Gemmatimonadaceae bacterium]
MRSLFYYTGRDWTGEARAFAVAARGLAARGEPVTIVCRPDGDAEMGFTNEELDVITLPVSDAVSRDAWRLRAVLKERFIEVVFLHTEREQLVASSAMRLAGRGAIVRRIPTGGTITQGRGTRFAARLASARLLFTTEE